MVRGRTVAPLVSHRLAPVDVLVVLPGQVSDGSAVRQSPASAGDRAWFPASPGPVIVMKMTIMTAVKSAHGDCLQCPHHYGANCAQNVRFSGPTVCKSPAAHGARITCNMSCVMARRDSSAVKFGRVLISFISVLFYWLKPLVGGGGEESGVLGSEPTR